MSRASKWLERWRQHREYKRQRPKGIDEFIRRQEQKEDEERNKDPAIPPINPRLTFPDRKEDPVDG